MNTLGDAFYVALAQAYQAANADDRSRIQTTWPEAFRSGLCECGCGQPPTLAKQSRTDRGLVKGQPHRFIHGHQTRTRRVKRYRFKGRTLLHRLRAEAALGKPLPAGAVVHHADGSKRDDAPLVLCQDNAYHRLLHLRMRVLKAGGNPNTERICSACKKVLPLASFGRRINRAVDVCRHCNTRRSIERHRRLRAGIPDGRKKPRTHCRHGHELTADNLRQTITRRRDCIICYRRWQATRLKRADDPTT